MRAATWRGCGLTLRGAAAAFAVAALLPGVPALHGARADEVEEIMQLQKVPGAAVPAAAQTNAVPHPAPATNAVPAAVADAGTNGASTTFGTLPEALAEIERLNGAISSLQSEVRRQKITAHYNMGCVYKVCGQPRLAEQEFLKVLEIDPDDAGTHYNLGILYDDSLRNRSKAKLHYKRFVELAPQDPDAGNVQGWLMSLK